MFKYSMKILIGLIAVAVVGWAIWFIMDWHDKHPDGE
jgi:hypothetical protein